MVAPALPSLAADMKVTDEVVSQLMLSIFVLAYAVGPLFLGPLSEIYGRTIVLQLANLFFLVFNIGCAVSQTKVQMIVCRFFAGLGGSAPLAVSQALRTPPEKSLYLTTSRLAAESSRIVSGPKSAERESPSIVLHHSWAQPSAPSQEASSPKTQPGDGCSMRPQ